MRRLSQLLHRLRPSDAEPLAAAELAVQKGDEALAAIDALLELPGLDAQTREQAQRAAAWIRYRTFDCRLTVAEIRARQQIEIMATRFALL